MRDISLKREDKSKCLHGMSGQKRLGANKKNNSCYQTITQFYIMGSTPQHLTTRQAEPLQYKAKKQSEKKSLRFLLTLFFV